MPCFHKPVADPGFPRRGTPTLSLWRKPLIWQDFCQKLHENERHVPKGGGGKDCSYHPPWICPCKPFIISVSDLGIQGECACEIRLFLYSVKGFRRKLPKYFGAHLGRAARHCLRILDQSLVVSMEHE